MSKQTQTKENAAKWSGSLGFIMAAAGSAVGMGNLWRFPMLVGENGGGAFVLVYLICIFLVVFVQVWDIAVLLILKNFMMRSLLVLQMPE